MIDAKRKQLIDQIHASQWQFALAVTGGGSSAIGQLLSVPGASATVLEAIVPYSQSSLTRFLQGTPHQFCSEATARAMAMAALERARDLAEADFDSHLLLGIGSTASLRSDRPKRGDHRIFVAIQTARETRAVFLQLEKGLRTRDAEEQLAGQLILNTLAETILPPATQTDLPDLSLSSSEVIERECFVAPQAWSDLLLERVGRASGSEPSDDLPQAAIFPGSFNPPHRAHHEIIRIAEKKLGKPIACELSIENVDKSHLDFLEIHRRCELLQPMPIWLTRAATFAQKAKLFPNATFVVGADTILRIADPKYYHNETALRDAAIEQLDNRQARFLVFGRMIDGAFEALDSLSIPERLRQLCSQVPESDFRDDISSSALRASR